ncbi:MAG TPA: type III PLP-dependent enzyme, partial [Cytophagales bacterium]|nr:type III PLP-dependent enzyme [Cytophagales bacterium]
MVIQDHPKIRDWVLTQGTPTLFLSQDSIREAHRTLKAALPEVGLYYAVKANSTEAILKIWQEQEGYFDLCSLNEVDQVSALGVPPEHCIFTHPIKSPDTLKRVWQFGIRTFVADNPTELKKLLPFGKELQLLIRMAMPNRDALSDLALKFGILDETELLQMFRQAHRGGVRHLGLCFHCGSPAEDPRVMQEALVRSRNLVEKLAQEGIVLKTIDIGGGFPHYEENRSAEIMQYVAQFREALDWFANRGFALLAEPGRYVAGPAMVLATQVIGHAHRGGKPWYYLDDGLYNSLSGQLYEQARYPIGLLNP